MAPALQSNAGHALLPTLHLRARHHPDTTNKDLGQSTRHLILCLKQAFEEQEQTALGPAGPLAAHLTVS